MSLTRQGGGCAETEIEAGALSLPKTQLDPDQARAIRAEGPSGHDGATPTSRGGRGLRLSSCQAWGWLVGGGGDEAPRVLWGSSTGPQGTRPGPAAAAALVSRRRSGGDRLWCRPSRLMAGSDAQEPSRASVSPSAGESDSGVLPRGAIVGPRCFLPSRRTRTQPRRAAVGQGRPPGWAPHLRVKQEARDRALGTWPNPTAARSCPSPPFTQERT